MKGKLLSFLMAIVLIFQLFTASAFAMSIDAVDRATADAIDVAFDSEVVYVIDEFVTYYYGEHYTIVKDKSGYTRIDFLENGDILVDGTSIITYSVDNLSPSSYFKGLQTSGADYTWVLYESKTKYYNVIGLAPSVVGGIIGGAIGTKIGGLAGSVFSVAGGAIIGTIAGGEFPEYYITIDINKYYKSPVETQRPVTKTDYIVYHGPESNRKQNYWFTL